MLTEASESADDRASTAALENLSDIYLGSDYGLRPHQAGFEAAQRGAAKGSGRCAGWVGWCYENGKGADKDLEQAKAWYRKASDMGNEWARKRLAALSK